MINYFCKKPLWEVSRTLADPCSQSMNLNKSLKKNNIPSQLILFETGQHGWSTGKRLEPEGWIESFLKFYKNL